MVKKTIIICSIVPILLQSGSMSVVGDRESFNKSAIERFGKFAQESDNFQKSIQRFEKLGRNINTETVFTRFSELSSGHRNPENQITRAKKMFKGNDFFSNTEFNRVSLRLKKSMDIIREYNSSDYILYLTSSDVPSEAMVNILLEVGILQKNGVRIKTKQYLRGIPEDFRGYVMEKKEFINALPRKARKLVLPNFKLKLDPRFFDKFKLESAPAMLFAKCSGRNPSLENCDIKYLIRGDASLTNFFDKIKDKNNKYNNYYKVLLGNQINKKEKGELR